MNEKSVIDPIHPINRLHVAAVTAGLTLTESGTAYGLILAVLAAHVGDTLTDSLWDETIRVQIKTVVAMRSES